MTVYPLDGYSGYDLTMGQPGGPVSDNAPAPFGGDVVSFLQGNESYLAATWEYRNNRLVDNKNYFEVRPSSTFPIRLNVIDGDLWFFGNGDQFKSDRVKTLWRLDPAQ